MLLAITVILSCCVRSTDSWRRRRGGGGPPPCGPRNCVVGSWNAWSACSHQCGTSGTQRRTRPQVSPASCGGSCPYTFSDNRACNRDNCRNGGTPHSSGCSCRPGYKGTCCEGGKEKYLCVCVERLRITVVGYCWSGSPGCHPLKFTKYHLIISHFYYRCCLRPS